ncbi:hypothetical protein [Streptomyces sp. NPDC058612]|uniref:hypothetical protein n=1 Tax=Streptomyces sp. NPDC058612 TaxID=3346555 RepID=UPI00364E8728
MTPRGPGAVAEAVGAVLAARLQQDLQRLGQPVPDSVAAFLARNLVTAVRQDGWHIAATPPLPAPTDTSGSPE